MMSSAIMKLVGKVETYIRKYYMNQLIKGLILSFFLVVTGYLFLNLIEYFAWMSSAFRMLMFYTFVLFLLYVLIGFVLIPVLNLIYYRKKMTVEKAAVFIGKYFPEIEDRLLNTLQLGGTNESDLKTNALLAATIEQRTMKLSVFNFDNAVNMRENFRFIPYISILFLVFVGMWIFSPSFFTEPSNRFIHYNQHFAKPLPFSVKVLNTEWSVMQYDDFKVEMEVLGEEIPEKFFVFYNGNRHLMDKHNTNSFSFNFIRVAENIPFFVESEEFKSVEYQVIVNPKPVLLSYQVEVIYPSYLSRDSEILKETNFMSVPVGTRLNWEFFTRDCQGIMIHLDSVPISLESDKDQFEYTFQVFQNLQFTVSAYNQFHSEKQGMDVIVEIINDNYPEINVSLETENMGKKTYFSGIISDDYGFSGLKFEYRVYSSDEISSGGIIEIPFDKRELQQQFYFSWTVDSLVIADNSRIEANFIVSDNDQISGPKSRKSEVFQLTVLTDSELDSIVKEDEKLIADQLEKLRLENNLLKMEYETFAKSLMMKEKLDWKDKNQLQSLLDKQQKIQLDFENLKEKQNKVNEFNRENKSENEQLVKKQEEIQKLFDEVIPEELKKMMEELKALLKETDKDKVKEMLDKFKENTAEVEKMLDRDLALLNQLKVEKDLTELIQKLKALAEEAKKLGDSLQTGDKNKEESIDALEKNLEDFKKLTDNLDTIQKINKQLEQPLQLSPTEEKENSINQKMQESTEEMKDGNEKTAGEKQEEAAEEMEEMADQLAMEMEESMEEQQAEDAQQLRNLLENVLRASLEQETLLNRTRSIDDDDPGFNEIVVKQKGLKDGFVVVEDSLTALAKRQVAIQQFVFDELNNVKKQFGFSLKALNERSRESVLESNQYTIMGLNNLALMLSEALNEMEEEMGKQNSVGGKGKPKPGKGSGKSLKSMRQLQESLGKQMKEKGDQKGKSSNQGMSSEEFAKMAAQQEAIRQQLQDYLNELKKEGNLGEGGLQNAIKEMEKIEEDLVNKRLNSEMIERQQDILSRLLESEKAEKERDQEERRESNEFKGLNKGNLGDKNTYKRIDKEQSDLLLKVPVELRPYYKSKANTYFMRINK